MHVNPGFDSCLWMPFHLVRKKFNIYDYLHMSTNQYDLVSKKISFILGVCLQWHSCGTFWIWRGNSTARWSAKQHMPIFDKSWYCQAWSAESSWFLNCLSVFTMPTVWNTFQDRLVCHTSENHFISLNLYISQCFKKKASNLICWTCSNILLIFLHELVNYQHDKF